MLLWILWQWTQCFYKHSFFGSLKTEKWRVVWNSKAKLLKAFSGSIRSAYLAHICPSRGLSMRKSVLKCCARPFGRIAAVRFTKSFMSSTKSPVHIGRQWWSEDKLSLYIKEILRLRVHFSYRLVVKIFATSSTSVSGTLSIFNLPNGKWICGNTNWRGQGNMFWNHLWIPSWRSIIFGQTQHRRT